MIINKIAMILCASLIAAVVLPFSSMNFVEAENSDSEEIQELRKRINVLESSKHMDSSTSFKLQQYELALEWFQAEGNPEEQRRIMVLITESFPDKEDYTPGVNATSMPKTYMGPIYYTGSTEKNFNCQSNSDDFGNIFGSVTMYGSGGVAGAGYTYWAVNMDYPYEISEQGNITCYDDDWNNSRAFITSITNAQNNCSINSFSSSTDGEGRICNDIEAGMLVSVSGNSFYSSGTSNPFSPFASERLLFLWVF